MYVHMLLGCTLRGNAYGVAFCLSIVPGGGKDSSKIIYSSCCWRLACMSDPRTHSAALRGKEGVADACMTLPKGDRWNHFSLYRRAILY